MDDTKREPIRANVTLRSFRTFAGVSVQEMARRLGVSKEDVLHVEATPLRLQETSSIAEYLAAIEHALELVAVDRLGNRVLLSLVDVDPPEDADRE